MNKIFSGILGLVAVMTLVTGTAYALFSSKATVQGLSVSTSNAVLRFADGTNGGAELWNANKALTGVKPGFQNSFDFTLLNTGDVNLGIFGKLTHAEGDWEALKDSVSVAVNIGDATTGWHTLNEWNTVGYEFPLPAISGPGNQTYSLWVMMPSTVGVEAMGKTLSNITFEVTGTQI
jgi:hypothetical protein